MKKQNRKESDNRKTNHIRNTVFILAILILYIPMVQLAITTFIPRTDAEMYPRIDCAQPYKETLTDEEQLAQQRCFDEQQAQAEKNDAVRQERDTIRFVVAALISFLTVLLVALLSLESVISYGLFGGAALNILFSLRFSVNKSLTGFIVLLVLFIASIWFIRKQMRKEA